VILNFIGSGREPEKKSNLVLVFCNFFLKYDHCRLLIGR